MARRGGRDGHSGSNNDLPLLPGYRAYKPGELTRARPQLCSVSRGVAGLLLKDARNDSNTSTKGKSGGGSGGMFFGGDTSFAKTTSFLDNPPPWLAYDKKVLRYNAYFTEQVVGHHLEKWRVRRCHILMYLEDSSLQVLEPHEVNSGLQQGTLLKRHRINKPGGGILTWQDLQIGGQLQLYGRTYNLLGCDAFTRSWLQQQGATPPSDSDWPEGPYDTAKREEKEWQQYAAQHKPPSISPRMRPVAFTSQALEHQGKVLRFYCCWAAAARSSVPGSRETPMPYVLHYYLADDNVEVREVHPRNDGRDPFPMLLSKRRLPKTIPAVGPRPLSAQSRAELKTEYYQWQELRVGSTVHVYGRELMLLDCDEFTRAWYMQQAGLSREQLAPLQVDFDNAPKAPVPEVPASWLGVGKEEDSAQSVFRLVPRPLMQDSGRWLALDGLVMRFGARLVLPPDYPEHLLQDAERRFVLSYYLADDSMSIFEPVQRNSGLQGGTFLERSRIKRPAEAAPAPAAQQQQQHQQHNPSSTVHYQQQQQQQQQRCQQQPWQRPLPARPLSAPAPATTPPRFQHPFAKHAPLSHTRPHTPLTPQHGMTPMAAAALAARVAVGDDAREMFYTDADLYIGAQLHIYGRRFELREADEFTLKLMEQRAEQYPHADAAKVVPDISSALQPHMEEVLQQLQLGSGSDIATAEALHAVMQQLGVERTLHEVITFCRACGGSTAGLTGEQLLAVLT